MANVGNPIPLYLGLEQNVSPIPRILQELGVGEIVVSVMDGHRLCEEGVRGSNSDLIVVYIEGLVEFLVFVLGVLGFEEGFILGDLD